MLLVHMTKGNISQEFRLKKSMKQEINKTK